ncbi:major facilitator superfamily domain-containing protein [Aspergillus bertholletiae]|uniref:Major facilitator superfamily domain-containing protein n=1 Tax=Aspergillus bertholletiae TaxID=1226010 RepID=A0A5N7BHB8_9EURO|nr:major facilitator superfamily domain-containing protein [Aspergillus bertholletiae]
MDSQADSELRKTCDSSDVSPTNPLQPSVSRKSMVRPFDFSRARKLHIVVAGIYFVFNSSLGSSLPSGAHDAIADYFHIPRDDLKMVLPTSLYMAGFAIGPLIFGPLSERFGRKPIMVSTFAIYNLFTMACALAPNFPALLIFRFLCGLGGSAPNAVLGGLFSDIYNDPHQRGMVMSIFMFATTFPPLLGPIISGFISTVSWRWTFWAGFIIGGVGFPLVLVMPETYMPVLCRAHEKAVGHSQIDLEVAKSRLHEPKLSDNIGIILSRPFTMIVQEPIVFCCSMYLALIYSILYLFFQAYPIVFQGLYGMTPGIAGLAFLPILPGSVLAFVAFILYSSYHTKALQNGLAWAKVEEYRRLPLACIAAPAIPIALFWLGWSSRSSIHPVMPMMSGVFFGFGYLLIFIALLNYLTDAYKQYSASAAAAASTLRSIFAVCLPLATTPMYTKLGIDWASSLLGFFAMAMAIIPFVFIKYGSWIRENSKFAQRAAQGYAPS